jgi:ferrous-iron efflux pump FieF
LTATEHEARLLRIATLASVAVALSLVAIKAFAWWYTGSVSVLASLVDSMMDGGASLINLLAVRYALVPADRSHRFGHGKAEALAGLGQSLFILLSGLFLINEAVGRFLAPEVPQQVPVGVAVMVISIGATLGLVMLQRWVIRQTHSTAISADSLHYKMDVLTNAAVLVVLAVSGLGFGLVWLDPLLALLIAGYTLMSVRNILQASLDELLDRELPQEVREAILANVRAHPEVCGAHDLRTRRSGRTEFIELHLELPDEMPLRRAHVICDAVEARLLAEWPKADIVIHQDPVSVAEFVRDEAIAFREHQDVVEAES